MKDGRRGEQEARGWDGTRQELERHGASAPAFLRQYKLLAKCRQGRGRERERERGRSTFAASTPTATSQRPPDMDLRARRGESNRLSPGRERAIRPGGKQVEELLTSYYHCAGEGEGQAGT